MRPTRIREKEMIADVILKNGWYQSLNQSGKKIQEKHESSMGELQGFTGSFMVFHKDGFKHLMRHSERLQKNTKAVLECLKMPQGHL